MIYLRLCLLGLCCVGFQGSVIFAEESVSTKTTLPMLITGPEVGQEVRKFYSRVVTGPLKNQSVCFVCRSGDRPAVMILTRSMSPDLRLFLRNVDRIVNQHRAAGLRSFGVLLTNDQVKGAAQVQTFAFTHKIKTPLSVGSPAIAATTCQNVSIEADITVVLYDKNRVVASYAYRPGEFQTAHMQSVLRHIQLLASVSTSPMTP